MYKDLKLPKLVQQILLVTRDHILSSSAKCHMLVLATPKFLKDNPHLKPSAFEHAIFGPVVVLNITPQAIGPITLGDDFISFEARYSGALLTNFVTMGDIVGLYSPEEGSVMFDVGVVNLIGDTGMGDGSVGMIAARPLNSYEPAESEAQVQTQPVQPPRERPSLKVVK